MTRTRRGGLAVTAVLTSLYPAVTIVLARTVLGERLTAMRVGGLALAGICVSLIALGGAGLERFPPVFKEWNPLPSL